MSTATRISAIVLFATSAAVYQQGCTAFDDVSPPTGGGGSAGTSTTASGGAGGGDAGDAGGHPPNTYLSLSDAARLCGMAEDCPNLATSIVVSFALPIARDNKGLTLVLSQSDCINWLAGPLPKSRQGYGVVQPILQKMALDPDCATAAHRAPIEFVDPGDCSASRCDTVDGESVALTCTSTFGIVSHCESDFFKSSQSASCLAVDSDAGTAYQCGYSKNCTNAQDHTPSCKSEDATLYCDPSSRVLTGIDCAYVGLACANKVGICKNTDADGQVAEACGPKFVSLPGQALCKATGSGSVMRFCEGEIWAEFDCEEIGAHCVSGGTLEARCAFDDEPCKPTDGTIDLCSPDQKTLSACFQGQPQDIECTNGTKCEDGHCKIQ